LLTPGTRLGAYEIEVPLAEGGMGQVYRARDTRLDRAVAIKVLRSDIADDRQARERFEREARAISHISHPHICTLYDIGDADGTSFLVMELLDGETLAARLRRGPLPIDQALTIGGEIADAIDKAHRAGIVHGDLKPENVMLTRTGVKLLDFGLARQGGVAPVAAGSDGVTTTTTIANPGVVVGTLQYLAPEQLEGKEADPRSDIFALGAVLYEIVTGRKAFDGHTPAAVIAAIMQHEPAPVTQLRPQTPRALEHVIATCLAKDPDARWQHAGDLARELAWVASSELTPHAAAPLPSRPRIWMALAAVFLIAAVALAALLFIGRRPGDVAPIRTSILLPEGLRFPGGGAIGGVGRFALSPDGRRIAFVATDAAGNQMLWVRSLDSLKATPIPDTDGAFSPFWSPDSKTIGFIAQNQLNTVDPSSGGSPVVVASPAANTTAAWSRDNVILFTPTFTSALFSVPASGGTPRQVTTLDPSAGDVLHRNPSFLPDGRHFLYVAAGRSRPGAAVGPRAVFVGSLDDMRKSTQLVASGTSIRYAQGRVIFVRENTLVAQPFDVDRLTLTGEPKAIAEQVELLAPGSAAFSLSDSGVLAYQPSSEGSQLIWFDRTGRQLSTVGDPGMYDDLEISPDAHHAAVTVVDANTNTRDLWIFDVDRGVRTRFTSDPAEDVAPVWSPDGGRIAFASNRKGHYDVWEKSASGLTMETLLVSDATEKYPTSWLPDGRRLLVWSFDVMTNATGLSIFSPDRKVPTPFLSSPASPGRLSPDGKWVAYSSIESGRSEVYVVPFPMASRKVQVSTAGGTLPRWRSDSRELFYAGRDNRLMAVSVEGSGSDLEIGTPRALFEARPVGTRAFYDVVGDGNRFLVNSVRGESTSPSISLVQNWTAAVKP
jgi:Tol biopolymer transport system component